MDGNEYFDYHDYIWSENVYCKVVMKESNSRSSNIVFVNPDTDIKHFEIYSKIIREDHQYGNDDWTRKYFAKYYHPQEIGLAKS